MKLYLSGFFVFCCNFLLGQEIVFDTETPFLYRNCINELRIVSPRMGVPPENYRIELSDGDTLLTDNDDPQRMLIIPRNYSVTFRLCRTNPDGETVKSFTKLKVLEPPVVSYVFEVDGRRSENVLIHKGSRVSFRILADSDFSERMPEETDYRIDSVRVYLQSERLPPRLMRKYAFSVLNPPQYRYEIPLPEECFQNESGSRIYIEAGELYRLNAAGQLIYVPFRGTFYDRVGIFEIE